MIGMVASERHVGRESNSCKHHGGVCDERERERVLSSTRIVGVFIYSFSI